MQGQVFDISVARMHSVLFGGLVTGLLIVLGLIALVIPGIVLLVRYALLGPAVVLEGADPSEARRRSTELTSGIRWQIFGAGFLFFVAFAVLSYLIYLPLGLFQELDTIAINVVLDCLLDVAFAVIQIVMFLYYWETAREKGLKLGTHELGGHPIS